MKRFVIFALIVLVFCLAIACAPNNDTSSSELPETTEALSGEETASVYTIIPTETAVNDIASPAPAEIVTNVLSFDKCAEEVLRLTPCYSEDGSPYLPEDAANDVVRYVAADGTFFGPEIFAVDGNTIIVGNVAPMIYDVKVFANSNFVRRVICMDVDHNGSDLAVLSSGVMYKEIGAFSIETGELLSDTFTPYLGNFNAFLFQHAVSAQHYGQAQEPAFIICESMGKEGDYVEEYEIYRLNTDFMVWHKTETICRMLPAYDGSQTVLLMNSGKELTLPGSGYALIGVDSKSNLFLSKLGETEKLIKISSDVSTVSELEFPFGSDDQWDPVIRYQLGSDGAVYAAISLSDAYIVLKITM